MSLRIAVSVDLDARLLHENALMSAGVIVRC